jgi:hypothetical protein
MATTKILVKTDAEEQRSKPTSKILIKSDTEEQYYEKHEDDTGSHHIQVGNFDMNIENEKIPLVGVAASAIVLIIAVGIGYVKRHLKEYGFTIGAIALIIAIFGLFKSHLLGAHSIHLNYFLFVWCFIGACIMTGPDGPFNETGNGYFASWALVICSAMSMGLSNETLPLHIRLMMQGMNLILGLGACAVVVMISTVTYFDNKQFYSNGESILAVAVSVLTLLIVVNLGYAKYINNLQMKQYEVPTLATLAALWVITAIITTFRGPFTTTGNGYFACWAGTACAVKATINAKNSR